MKKHLRFIFVFILGLILLSVACGKKGPPFLPKTNFPLKVGELVGRWHNGSIIFTGNITNISSKEIDSSTIVGFRIYHASFPFDSPPCEGCPIQFQAYEEIKGRVLNEGQFFWGIPFPKLKGHHFFEIRLLGKNGGIGPTSNRVKLVKH